jgi:hypothetical protein
MVLTKNLQWTVGRWFTVMNESINAPLSCCHPVFCPRRGFEMIGYPQPLGSSWSGLLGPSRLTRLPGKQIDPYIMEIQWHLNQITAETGLNDSERHAHEPRTSKERRRRRLHYAKPSAPQPKLRRMTNKISGEV